MPKRLSIEITKRSIENALPSEWLWDGGARGVPGLCVRVTGAGTKTFLFRYRTEGGHQRYAKIGIFPAITLDDARSNARKYAGAVADGKDPSRDRRALREAPTLSDLAEEYLGAYASSRLLRPSTIQASRSSLNAILPALGRKKVAEFTITDIRKIHGDMRVRGWKIVKKQADALLKALADAQGQGDVRAAARIKPKAARLSARVQGHAGVYQANRLLAVLSKMFSLAIERGWRADNPCRGVSKFPEDQRWRNLSDVEVARLLFACDAYEMEHAMEPSARGAADAVRLLLFTGARLREALWAEWDQFNLDVGLWEKPSAHTKTRRQHRLELDGPALELLKEMRRRAGVSRYLFPSFGSKRGSKVKVLQDRPRFDLKRPWVWMTREAGLENVQLHDLRRTTASFMLSGGASLATVGKALGHTQAATTQRYAHLSQTVQRDELRKAGDRMVALRGGMKAATISNIRS